MAGDLITPADVPKAVPLGNLQGVDVSAEEGYLLSRIDGRTDVGTLVALVGWGREKTLVLLEALLRKHLVNFDRPEISEAVLGRAKPRVLVAPAPAPAGRADDPAGGSSGAAAAPPPAVGPTLAVIGPSIDPSTIEKVPELEPERCLEVLYWQRQVTQAKSRYGILGIPDGADVKAVKREYRLLALKFHPDKYFRKEIGGYRTIIEQGWQKVQEAYEFLSDPEDKAAYDAELLGRGTELILEPAGSAAGSGTAAGGDASTGRRVESPMERKLKAEVEARIQRARALLEQAQADFRERRFGAVDANLRMARQFDPRNEQIAAYYAEVRDVLEANLVGAALKKAEALSQGLDPMAALPEFERALALFPDNLDANRSLGFFLLGNGGDYKRARDCLQKVVSRRPRDVRAFVGMARCSRLLGQKAAAERLLDQAKAVDPKDAGIAEELKELQKLA